MSPGLLVVDGMNVIGSRPDGWWRDRDGAAKRLLGRLQVHARATGTDIALVLDGRAPAGLPAGTYTGVDVVYARRAGRDAGDDRIVELVRGLDEPATARVITSDRELARRVRDLGADVASAGSLLALLDGT